METEILNIKESRLFILFAFIFIVILTISVGMFTFTLLQDSEVLSQNFHIQFELLITIMIIGIKDGFFMSLILLKKIFYPCSLKFTKQGFFSSELNQFINWNQIDKIEYLDYSKMFFKKSNFWSYFLYMFIANNLMGVTFEFFKRFLLVGGDSKILIIKTPFKKSLLKNANIFNKIENKFLPDNFIQLELALDLAVEYSQDKILRDIVFEISKIQTKRI